MYQRTRARAVAKAVSWRVVGTFATSSLVFLFTRKVLLALAVGGLDLVGKTILFWLHELVWDGAVRSTSTWGVVKGAPNRNLAWEFIQFTTQPKPQAMFNTTLYYGPINPAAFEMIPHDIAVQLPTWPANQAISVKEDDKWEADRIVGIEERFTQWVAS